jgi:2-polyprenyl-3-methyl-5-hydroxy-6-metoxy-1,4-benzoquinol methylase
MLDLFSSHGIPAEGVDILPEAVEYCRAKGYRAQTGDAVDFLADKLNQYDGILCSHVIEHLDYDRALRLVELCARALTSGNLVLVTPNARDINIISEVFWLDPTHRRPYPADLLKAMLETAGFEAFRSWAPLVGPERPIQWPVWLVRKLALGRYFGCPELIASARKS